MAEKLQKDIMDMQNQIQLLFETINSNFLTIMSMCVGINLRINAQEMLLREILGKINRCATATISSTQDEKSDQSDEEPQSSVQSKEDENGDDNSGDGFNMFDHLATSMGTSYETESNNKSISCYECKQVFVRGTGEFTRHLRETSCRPYGCDLCQKLFKKKSNMKAHRLTHQKRNHEKAFVKEEETSNDNDQQSASSGEPEAKRMKTSSTVISRIQFEEFMAQHMKLITSKISD